MTTRGVTGIVIALEEEVMVGVGLVLTEGHQVQCIAGAQVLTMVVLAALFMIGTVALHMTGTGVLIMVGTGVLNMADIGADHLLEGQELERESPVSVEVVMKNLAPICYSLV
jgi:hypothetical protein